MPELDLLKGWAPQAYGIWLIAAMFAIYLLREWRETRKLSSADRQARSEGFQRQVDGLMKENRELRVDLRHLRSEYDEYRRVCQEENDQRLQENRRLEDHIRGLERQIQATSESLPRVIDDKLRQAREHDTQPRTDL